MLVLVASSFLTMDITPVSLSAFGVSVIKTVSDSPWILNPVLFIFNPSGFTLNSFPKHSSYWANWLISAFKFLLIFTRVILEVIELSILSITFNTLLYLNLPPNLLRSADLAYVVRDDDIFDWRSFTFATCDEL